MAHEIMIPDAATLPAHIVNSELARQMNEDAVANVSTGMPCRIKMAGKSFALVDGSGAEAIVKNKELTEGPDENMYLKTVVLKARKDLQKVYYINEYDPNAEATSPDCFSNDGQRPDVSVKTPQCDNCANCPHNQYGSSRKGAGKACSDNKILAVFVPNKGVHQLKITPASLRNWGQYVKKLSAAGIPVGMVFTLVGFDEEATFPVLTFQYGGPLPETAVEKLAAMAGSVEVTEIIEARIQNATPKDEAPQKQEKKQEKKEESKKEEPKEEEPQKEEPTPELSDADIAAELGL